ncbi:MAG: hypothetical protein ABWY16_04430 [Pedobacter sp.]|uniref:hypothetical protein n=1 Tax=Pedobacter sp. TaxID=1411316 RepID=UPI003392609A
MKSIHINVDQEIYKVEQAVSTINIYKIIHQKGFYEITRNRFSGKWKVLLQTDSSENFPLGPIGKAIEENLGVVN